MNVHDYVKELREKEFEGSASAVYINSLEDLDFAFDTLPERVKYVQMPPFSQLEFPIAVVYKLYPTEVAGVKYKKVVWVDSNGRVWVTRGKKTERIYL